MSYPIVAIAAACIFLAAIVRGHSGFGSSLLSIASLSRVLSPAEMLSSIFMLEVVASLRLLPEIWKDLHWRSLTPSPSAAWWPLPLASFCSPMSRHHPCRWPSGCSCDCPPCFSGSASR
jgi:hypothetical protein